MMKTTSFLERDYGSACHLVLERVAKEILRLSAGVSLWTAVAVLCEVLVKTSATQGHWQCCVLILWAVRYQQREKVLVHS